MPPRCENVRSEVTPVLTVLAPPTRAAEREYAARTLFEEFLGLPLAFWTEPRRDTEIRVQGDNRRRVVVADGLLGVADDAWLRESSLPRVPVPRLRLSGTPFRDHPADDVPVLYGVPSWSADADGVTLDIDVLGGSFFLLTRYEELVLADRDEHDRFPASATVAARAGLLRRPIVNEYLELLWLALHHVWPSLERRPLAFEVRPSHDVDWPLTGERDLRRVLRRTAADAVVARDPGAALRRLAGYAGRSVGRHDWDVNNTFDLLMDASERRGLRSAFYFIAEHPAGAIDGDYSLDDPWIRRLLRRIHARGHEIGLHASYTTYTDPQQTRRERNRLLQVCDEERIGRVRVGGRQHFLRWRNPSTWRNWAEAGLDYDSTLGFVEDVGFRAGVCLEYPVFDLEQRRPLGLRELPLVAMEGAALDRLGLGHELAAETFAELRETCRRYGGTFTLLWHNSRAVHRGERRLYFEALGG